MASPGQAAPQPPQAPPAPPVPEEPKRSSFRLTPSPGAAARKATREQKRAEKAMLKERKAAEKRAAKERKAAEKAGQPPPTPAAADLPPTADPGLAATAAEALEPEQPIAPTPGLDERLVREAAEREAVARLEQAEGGSEEDRLRAESERVRIETEQRIQEAEEVQVAAPEPPPAVAAGDASPREALMRELHETDRQLVEGREQEAQLANELEQAEQRLLESQRRTAEALEQATQRLEAVEGRVTEAEERAARAERLVELKAEGVGREGELREMLDRIAEAEERAAQTEQRARDVVRSIDEPPPADPI